MKCGVVVFPGSNCDHDVYHVLKHVLQQDVTFLWHQDDTLAGCELVVLPGGFAYGDYLRAGAMAALSPVMGAVKRHAEAGGLVLGICNPGGNVLGMMPHPERCSEPILGNTDGLTLLASAVEAGSQVLGARR